MITVPQKTKEIILESEYLTDALSLGILNLSEVARMIKPQIEKELIKGVTNASIIMALKRLSKDIKLVEKRSKARDMFGDLTVRSNLMEFTYANSSTLPSALKSLLNRTPEELFLTWTRGVHETTVIVSRQMEKELTQIFAKERLKLRKDELSTITIHMPVENIDTSGVYYYALKLLAWKGINIIEAVSTYTELTIVLESKDIVKSLQAFKPEG